METINLEYITRILQKILNTPSVSGDTSEATELVAAEFDTLGLNIAYTQKGALIATLKGADDDTHRTLSAHIDTLGGMVREIKANGRLGLTNVGGYMWPSVEGENCRVKTSAGKTYTGTILTTKASTHVHGGEAAKLDRKEANMELRLDEMVTNAEEVRNLDIEVGDFVSFNPRTQVTSSGYIKSRHLDDKVSIAIILGAVKYLVENNIALPYTTHFFITNYEEIGHGAAVGIPAKTREFLAVDMGCVGDGLQGSEHAVSICAKDSSGPYDYGLRKKLVSLAEQHNVDFKVDVFPYYGSDASAALRAGADIVHGLIGPGVDASHAYERTHVEGMLNTVRLILAYIQSK